MIEVVAGVGFTAAIGCIGWVMHLGSRVSVVESKQDSFERWLERIEAKLDLSLANQHRTK